MLVLAVQAHADAVFARPDASAPVGFGGTRILRPLAAVSDVPYRRAVPRRPFQRSENCL